MILEYIYGRLIIRIKGGVGMDFLNKLYESNYFGIGLFAVISFLVVTFLVVLFFGKKDEKRTKLEETNKLNIDNNHNVDAFKEVSTPTPVEIQPEPIAPVAPISYEAPAEEQPVLEEPAPVIPTVVPPILPTENIAPVAPINYDVTPSTVAPVEEPQVAPVIEEKKPEPVVFETPVVPIISEPVITPLDKIEQAQPVIPEEPVNSIFTEPSAPVTIEPIKIEPTKYDIPSEPVTPEIMEPVKFNIPEEPVSNANSNITPTIVEEPIIMDSYYKPVEEPTIPEVKVPDIDFDALAKSISDELDALEKAPAPKVTPINETNNNTSNLKAFSSVYVDAPQRPTPKVEPIDLPKKIDLPKRIEK